LPDKASTVRLLQASNRSKCGSRDAA